MSCGTGAGGVQLNAPPRRALAYLVRGSAVTLAVEGLAEPATLGFGGPDGLIMEMPAEFSDTAALWPLSASTVDELLDDGVSHVRIVIGDAITYAGPVVQMSGWSGETQAHQVMARHIAGARGPAGASAYEVAVAAGYEGTEAEWLESLTPDVDLSALATKTELADGLATKAEDDHTHAEYLTADDLPAAPDLSGLATKTELADGDAATLQAAKDYTDAVEFPPPPDLSGLATKTELADVAAAATGSFLPLSGNHDYAISATDKLAADYPDAKTGDWSVYNVGSGFTRTPYLFVKGVQLGNTMSNGWGTAAIGVAINDSITHHQTTWSSLKIEQAIAAGGGGGGSDTVAVMLTADTPADDAYDLTPALNPGVYAVQGVLLETYGYPGQVGLTSHQDLALRWTIADDYGYATSDFGYQFEVNATGNNWGVLVEFSGVLVSYTGGSAFYLEGSGGLAPGSYVRYEKIGEL